jgi:hypothetical protein
METDDLKRNRSGVVCTLVLNDEGHARLVMDDAESSTATSPQMWLGTTLFTWMDFPQETFVPELNFSESQLADIGLALVARLSAFEKTKGGKKP